MKNIYLVRHGQDEDNSNGLLNGHRNTPLTDIGRQQAHDLSQKIKISNISCNIVLTSPLKRASETAEIICNALDWATPIVEPLLIERNFGIMTGLPQSKIIKICSPEIINTKTITYFLSPSGAETFPDLITRSKKLLEKLNKYYIKDNVMLVTHGDFGKMLYAAYYDLDWVEVLKQFHFGNSEMILLSPDSPANDVHVFKIKQYNT
jgi:broad specificity phosphatase PhoE